MTEKEHNIHINNAGCGILGTIVLISSVLICINRNRGSDVLTQLLSLFASIFFAPIYLPYAIIKCGGEAYSADGKLLKSSCFAPPTV